MPESLADLIDAALPQTQCTRCGYPDCRGYAEAVAKGEAGINQCPPGGQLGIEQLARLTGQASLTLNPVHGSEGPLRLARIDETWCIGCTLCIKACPVDCIIGAPKAMHTVIEADCTGCELCLPACPVDCIEFVEATPGLTGWAAWSPQQANRARLAYGARQARRERSQQDHEERRVAQLQAKLQSTADAAHDTDAQMLRKRAIVEAAIARARARLGPPPASE